MAKSARVDIGRERHRLEVEHTKCVCCVCCCVCWVEHMLWVEQEGVVWLGGKVWWKDNVVSRREGSVV